jgi:hypothetical protein
MLVKLGVLGWIKKKTLRQRTDDVPDIGCDLFGVEGMPLLHRCQPLL